jgi:hypothetical protein
MLSKENDVITDPRVFMFLFIPFWITSSIVIKLSLNYGPCSINSPYWTKPINERGKVSDRPALLDKTYHSEGQSVR